MNMVLTILVAYPLSKTKHQFHARQFYVWFFFITMLFSGGLIPYYMTISKVGLVDSFWALILPGAVPVYNVIILLNFFRNLPGKLKRQPGWTVHPICAFCSRSSFLCPCRLLRRLHCSAR